MDQQSESQSINTCVKVVVRIRPLNYKEHGEGANIYPEVTPNIPQISMGNRNAFTFDHVFDTESTQPELFELITNLIDGTLEGKNATILAYGQTGSGKSYTMGTSFSREGSSFEISEDSGIIHRSVQYLFDKISYAREAATDWNRTPPNFQISAKFVELYNDEIKDLITKPSGARRSKIKIIENSDGSIILDGVSAKPIISVVDALHALQVGNLLRQTETTHRSHAIFTLYIKESRIITLYDGSSDSVTFSSKIHFVDLAGSERLKRTGAVGEPSKEGISINSGLLALSNVLSALGDKSLNVSLVPYRDSKLTRLLSDSLGGDSETLMIACICPSVLDFLETLNTLRYANRAKNINKNQVTVNQDKSSRTISLLRKKITDLESELQAYIQDESSSSRTIILLQKQIADLESEVQAYRQVKRDESETDLMSENRILLAELDTLRSRNKALSDTVDKLMAEKLVNSPTNLPPDESTAFNIPDLIENYVLKIDSWKSRALKAENELKNINEMSTNLSSSSLTLQEVDATRVKIEKQ